MNECNLSLFHGTYIILYILYFILMYHGFFVFLSLCSFVSLSLWFSLFLLRSLSFSQSHMLYLFRVVCFIASKLEWVLHFFVEIFFLFPHLSLFILYSLSFFLSHKQKHTFVYITLLRTEWVKISEHFPTAVVKKCV